jgi:hypothetical protein
MEVEYLPSSNYTLLLQVHGRPSGPGIRVFGEVPIEVERCFAGTIQRA